MWRPFKTLVGVTYLAVTEIVLPGSSGASVGFLARICTPYIHTPYVHTLEYMCVPFYTGNAYGDVKSFSFLRLCPFPTNSAIVCTRVTKIEDAIKDGTPIAVLPPNVLIFFSKNQFWGRFSDTFKDSLTLSYCFALSKKATPCIFPWFLELLSSIPTLKMVNLHTTHQVQKFTLYNCTIIKDDKRRIKYLARDNRWWPHSSVLYQPFRQSYSYVISFTCPRLI